MLQSGLALGLTALGSAGLTGCTAGDPTVHGPPPSSGPGPRSSPNRPSTTAPPMAGSPAALEEQRLAATASAILRGPHRAQLTEHQRRLLLAAQEVHEQHGWSLTNPEPASRPTSGPAPHAAAASAGKLSPAQAVSAWTGAERAQVRRLRSAALAGSGLDCLLWGSMAVAAGSLVAAAGGHGTATLASVRPPEPMASVSDVAALQAMVRQEHALVYGYQVALGQLSLASPGGHRAAAGLRFHRRRRNALTAELVRRSADVPVAAPAYVLPVRPKDPSTAGRLIRGMETALMPFCGLWLASATRRSDRVRALDTLAATSATARYWGASLAVWPGWSD